MADFNVFYNAGTLIIICAKPFGPLVDPDCWLAEENLLLAACATGLGSYMIGYAILALSAPEIKTEIGIPAEVTLVAPIIVCDRAAGRLLRPGRSPRFSSGSNVGLRARLGFGGKYVLLAAGQDRGCKSVNKR